MLQELNGIKKDPSMLLLLWAKRLFTPTVAARVFLPVFLFLRVYAHHSSFSLISLRKFFHLLRTNIPFLTRYLEQGKEHGTRVGHAQPHYRTSTYCDRKSEIFILQLSLQVYKIQQVPC